MTDIHQLEPSQAVPQTPCGLTAQAVLSLAERYGAGRLSAMERGEAEQVFRDFLRGADPVLRHLLAQDICPSADLPRDIAVFLARDVDSVARPMLRSSPALGDQELTEIARAGSTAKQKAIARRSPVSATLAADLSEAARAEAVVTLLANDAAEIDESTLLTCLGRFAQDGGVQAAMIGRRDLPAAVLQRLTKLASGRPREELLARHFVPANSAGDILEESRRGQAWWLRDIVPNVQ
jgi:uncharacterized protein (DUF2336 family)